MYNTRRDFLKSLGLGTTGIALTGSIFANPSAQQIVVHEDMELDNFFIGKNEYSPVFPIPQKADYFDGSFNLSGKTTILIPETPSTEDLFLARELRAEIAEKYGIIAALEKTNNSAGRTNYILMGAADNCLVSEYIQSESDNFSFGAGKTESYFLRVKKDAIIIGGTDNTGAFYGLQSLRQLIVRYTPSEIRCADILDWPSKPFRGIRIYVPGPDNIIFYKRFIRDFMAYFKYNKVILEMNACMRLDGHPELNSGGKEFYKDMVYTRRTKVTGPHEQIQNSTHHDAADGEILDKEQVADLVAYAKKFHIETIPEIPSLSHVYYLLTNHRELAEIKNAEWPDTYCPSNPKSRKLFFEVLDEYIEVMDPKMIHIGHDEWRMPTHVCEHCRDKDYKEIFIQDVNVIHEYLKKKNIQVAMWDDHLLVKRRTANLRPRTSSTGYEYKMPGGITPEQLKTRIPKDILVFNWSWKIYKQGRGEENDMQLSEAGFEQIHGNFETIINDYQRRSKLKGLIGGAPSVWAATNELNFGKIKIHAFVGCSNLLWSSHYHENHEILARYIQRIVPVVRTNLKGNFLPSHEGDPVKTIPVGSAFNYGRNSQPENIPLHFLKEGNIQLNQQLFDLTTNTDNNCAVVIGNIGETGTNLPLTSKAISVGKDVSSLIFLHTCAHPADNVNGHFNLNSFEDTADLLGWYKVVFEDGFIDRIPIRYGINIKEWHIWGKDPRSGNTDRSFTEPFYNGRGSYCYEGDIINCSSRSTEVNFFSYEWRNPRFGKKIKEVFLVGSDKFVNSENKIIESNAIALIALSYVEKRDINRKSAKYSA